MSRIRNTKKWITKKDKNAYFLELNVLSEELETYVLGRLIKDFAAGYRGARGGD
jgi:hypothetical protein